jgi:hypothetical protein
LGRVLRVLHIVFSGRHCRNARSAASLRAKRWRPPQDEQQSSRGSDAPELMEKAARAGCTVIFIGLENINPESLLGTKKRQNKIWEYREMLLAWRQHNVITYAGYILGFPTDTPESIARDIEIIKKELPVDILEFFCLPELDGGFELFDSFDLIVPKLGHDPTSALRYWSRPPVCSHSTAWAQVIRSCRSARTIVLTCTISMFIWMTAARRSFIRSNLSSISDQAE